jgi:hypothetical protein
MSENLKVKKENALKAYEAADDKGKKLLADLFPGQIVPINIHVRIAAGEAISFEDILLDLKITPAEYEEMIDNHSEHAAAFERAILISKAINKTPLTYHETWYVPYFTRSGSGFSYTLSLNWNSSSDVGARLCGFRRREDAIYAGKTFPHIYKPLL